MASAIDEAGLDGLTIHGLRYTAATRLREVGLDWEQIADITGHQAAEMTWKYSRQRRSAALAVVELDSALAGQAGRKKRTKNEKV